MIALLALSLSGPCHVIANGAVSDWYERAEALKIAQGWALLGITAEVVCRPPRKDNRIWS